MRTSTKKHTSWKHPVWTRRQFWSDATLDVRGRSASEVTTYSRACSQTADLFQAQNSAGVSLLNSTSTGKLSVGNNSTIGQIGFFDGSNHSVTINPLTNPLTAPSPYQLRLAMTPSVSLLSTTVAPHQVLSTPPAPLRLTKLHISLMQTPSSSNLTFNGTNFAVGTNQLFVQGSTGNVGIGFDCPDGYKQCSWHWSL